MRRWTVWRSKANPSHTQRSVPRPAVRFVSQSVRTGTALKKNLQTVFVANIDTGEPLDYKTVEPPPPAHHPHPPAHPPPPRRPAGELSSWTEGSRVGWGVHQRLTCNWWKTNYKSRNMTRVTHFNNRGFWKKNSVIPRKRKKPDVTESVWQGKQLRVVLPPLILSTTAVHKQTSLECRITV